MPIRLGIVGANEQARVAVEVLNSLEEARIVAVCDRDQGHAESLARRCKARAFRDVAAMLRPPSKRDVKRSEKRGEKSEQTRRGDEAVEESAVGEGAVKERAVKESAPDEKRPTLDAVCVFSFERNRNDAIQTAMANGCDVWIASPPAFSLEGAQKLLKFAHEQRGRVWIEQDIRFSPSGEHARRTLSSRGTQIFAVHGAWKIDINNATSKALRDSQLLTSIVRCVDALRFLHGEMRGVYARSSQNNLAWNVEFESGALGAIALSEFAETTFRWTTNNGLITWGDDEVTIQQTNHTQHFEYSNGAQNAQKSELRAWLRSVESGRRTLAKAKPEDALKNLRVALAVQQSLKTNKWVRLTSA